MSSAREFGLEIDITGETPVLLLLHKLSRLLLRFWVSCHTLFTVTWIGVMLHKFRSATRESLALVRLSKNSAMRVVMFAESHGIVCGYRNEASGCDSGANHYVVWVKR